MPEKLRFPIEVVLPIAKVCHAANLAYRDTIGDGEAAFQRDWEFLPLERQCRILHGVDQHLFNPNLAPSTSHELWLAHMAQNGWNLGEKEDAEAKTHPCMLPYDQLPEAQRRKDALFKAIVNALRPVA